MLLQLVEPTTSQSIESQWEDDAIGIDLGTTFSLAAYVLDGMPVVIPLEGEETRLPSAVSWQNESFSVGSDALSYLLKDPSSVMTSIKRLMGRLPYDLQEGEVGQIGGVFFERREDNIVVKMGEKWMTPVEVSAEILRVLKQRAERYLGRTIHRAVITVPAYFDEIARKATRDAAALAGLSVLRMVNEPTAALLAYGLSEKPEGLYAVYDLGGGTFDFSLLKLTRGVFQVLGTGGDVTLGGDDVDHALAQVLLEERQALGFNDSVSSDFYKTLVLQSRFVKEQLAFHESVSLKLESSAGLSEHSVSRETLLSLVKPLLERTCALSLSVLKEAGVEPKALHGIVLVGGSTRLLGVHTILKQYFSCPLFVNISPDEAVVCGAALQAHALTAGREEASLLIDVTPLSLGLETMGGIVERLIERNSTIPIAKAQVFTTYQDGQTAMKIHVVQGEREFVSDCRSLGEFILTGIPPMKAGLAKIQVTFTLDADGLLTVSAVEQSSGVNKTIEVKPSYGLGEAEMRDMLLTAFEYAEEDFAARKLRQTQVSARQDLERMKKILQEEEAEDAIVALSNAVRVLEENLEKETMTREKIDEAMKSLDQSFAPIIEKRMNKLFKDVVVGRKISELSK